MDEATTFHCPVCGTMQWLEVDPRDGPSRLDHDCVICCRPLWIDVSFAPDGTPHLEVRSDAHS